MNIIKIKDEDRVNIIKIKKIKFLAVATYYIELTKVPEA